MRQQGPGAEKRHTGVGAHGGGASGRVVGGVGGRRGGKKLVGVVPSRSICGSRPAIHPSPRAGCPREGTKVREGHGQGLGRGGRCSPRPPRLPGWDPGREGTPHSPGGALRGSLVTRDPTTQKQAGGSGTQARSPLALQCECTGQALTATGTTWPTGTTWRGPRHGPCSGGRGAPCGLAGRRGRDPPSGGVWHRGSLRSHLCPKTLSGPQKEAATRTCLVRKWGLGKDCHPGGRGRGTGFLHDVTK